MGFLNPLNLLLGLSLAALVAIYLRAQARPPLEVSSLALFEEAPAPVARSRILRVDLLFWLEAAALAALTLVAAGFYVRTTAAVSRPLRRALVFNLGASMGAIDPAHPHNGSRLAEAQQKAAALVNDAPAGDQFKLISYALDGRAEYGPNGRKADVLRAIAALKPTAVATRPSALRAAINNADHAERIDLFTDHPPPPELLAEARRRVTLVVHPVGVPLDNVAIVQLEPGVPKSAEGRCVVRNFSFRPSAAELKITVDGRAVFDSPLLIEPRALAAVRFGPIPEGGVLHATLSPADGLAADNERYALAPKGQAAHALVVSPDSDARDDLARVLLGVNPGFQVTAIDNSPAAVHKELGHRFDLVVLHETADPGLTAPARLLVFPPVGQLSAADGALRVLGTITGAVLQTRVGAGPLATPVQLGPSRLISLPGSFQAVAQGGDAALTTPFPLAAVGFANRGAVGLVAFDVRNHLLLDPDRLDALLLVIDTLRELSTPLGTRVVSTGDEVTIPTYTTAQLVTPDGERISLTPDRLGRVHVRPLEAGRYLLSAGRETTELYANYYDEFDSDLAVTLPPTAASGPSSRNGARPLVETRTIPLTALLASVVLVLLLVESVLLARRSRYWEWRHV